MEKYFFVGICGGELTGLLYRVMGDRLPVVGYFDSDEINQGCLSFPTGLRPIGSFYESIYDSTNRRFVERFVES
jgi:hypothetical protein